MTQPIQPGDLVMVVRGPRCCERVGDIGKTFAVFSVATVRIGCRACGADDVETVARTGARWPDTGTNISYPLYRLQRIDPLKEPESVERPEEVTA